MTASGRIQRRIRHAAVIKDIIIFYKNFISFPLEYNLIGKNVTSLSDGELTAPFLSEGKADDADLYFHSQVQCLFCHRC